MSSRPLDNNSTDEQAVEKLRRLPCEVVDYLSLEAALTPAKPFRIWRQVEVSEVTPLDA
jgi:hypothetical protein